MCDWTQVAFLLSVNLALIQSECTEPIRFYENINCYPIASADPRNECPIQFDCNHINPNSPRQCFYGGGYYQRNEEVDYADAPSCETTRCRCLDDLDFNCLGAECPYQPLLDIDDCYHTYDLTQCCATGQNCKSNASNTFRCRVGRRTYYDGQIFQPPSRQECKSCVCNRNFHGEYDSTVCNRIPCPNELYHSSQVKNFCAPVYFEATDCCASDFLCPTARDEQTLKIFRGKPNQLHCRFGKNLLLKKGTKITKSRTEDGETTTTKCECIIPPFLTCYRSFS